MFKKLLIGASALMVAVAVTAQHDHAHHEPSPEEKAVEFRHSVFHTLEWKMGKLVGAKMSGDQTAFAKHATDMAYIAGLIPEGFVANSLIKGSKAKPAVWENPEEFLAAAQNLQTKATELAAADYDMASFDPRKFGGDTCGGCHRKFKERD